MSIKLEQSLENREKIISSVEEELIGPNQIRDNYTKFNPIGNTVFESRNKLYVPYYWEKGDKKEEILQGETPLQRYVSGLLFPLDLVDEDEITLETPIEKVFTEHESHSDDEIFAYSEGLEPTEDDGAVELLPQNNDFKPSTMGLTFCVNKDTPNLKVSVSGGRYIPHTISVKDDKRRYRWWLRESISGTWNISLKELKSKFAMNTIVELSNAENERIHNYKIQLHARLRVIKENYIVTVSMTNRSEDQNIGLQHKTLFQACMEIKTPINYSFLVYPKQYEMKDNLSAEEATTELLYRNEEIFALGHGCAADWDQDSSNIREISTTFIPKYETPSMTPNISVNKNGQAIELEIKMSDLAGLSTKKHPKKILIPLIEGYKEWILKKEDEIEKGNIPRKLKPIARKHIALCRDSLKRMQRGLTLLDDERVLKAFKLANKAILLQQVNGSHKRQGFINGNGIEFDRSINEFLHNEQSLARSHNTWRAFQIAFILLSLESFVNEKSPDRDILDLVWFPTGGGKTEAYLGVAAFQMIYRRLVDPLDAGVDIIMRYTLRLLTADQFQRASRLICSLEYLRNKSESQLGKLPFSIGIWVGSKTTPNTNKNALSLLNKLNRNTRGAQQFIVNGCPWCGAELGYYKAKDSNQKYYLGYKTVNEELVIHCPDKKCHFYDKLPIYIVDETIYKKQPTFLIGTVDKFVQLVWQPQARHLFGIDYNGDRFVSPPSLIIQDEMHLISGPLGTLTGLFETLIEELCLENTSDGKVIKPKVIAATATIKQFEEQALALFGREEAMLFPSPGLDSEDSFFSRVAINKENGKRMPGRKYVGIYTQNVRIMMSQVMSFSAILQATQEINPKERDPYWSLLTFYNTLRELGAGVTLINTDIPEYSNSLAKRRGLKLRKPEEVLQLTSRKQSHEITEAIDDLKRAYPSNTKSKPIDVCLASNIIEVGIDIDRLSLMAIVGQPKMTAQYIQVSGRVGRRWWDRPGVIFTLYSNTKSRDKSHFEHFREYHQKLYAQVESSSVTPFSDASLDRGLHAIVIGFLRQALSDDLGRSPNKREIEKYLDNKILAFYNRLIERVRKIDPEQVAEVKERFKSILRTLQTRTFTSWRVGPEVEGYMYPAGTNVPRILKGKSVPMINSLRNVDSECKGKIVPLYEPDLETDSWERLFT